jgi:hypothetical protein
MKDRAERADRNWCAFAVTGAQVLATFAPLRESFFLTPRRRARKVALSANGIWMAGCRPAAARGQYVYYYTLFFFVCQVEKWATWGKIVRGSVVRGPWSVVRGQWSVAQLSRRNEPPAAAGRLRRGGAEMIRWAQRPWPRQRWSAEPLTQGGAWRLAPQA